MKLQEKFKAPYIVYSFECLDKDGNLKWKEEVKNLVTTEGLNDIINKYFKGASYTAAWYMGLKSTGAPDAADTLAAPVNWTIITPYAGNRPAITFGTTAGGSNTANAVSFSINATATVAGAFIASVNSGTAGILYSDSNFSVARGVANGDTLNVTATVVAA